MGDTCCYRCSLDWDSALCKTENSTLSIFFEENPYLSST